MGHRSDSEVSDEPARLAPHSGKRTESSCTGPSGQWNCPLRSRSPPVERHLKLARHLDQPVDSRTTQAPEETLRSRLTLPSPRSGIPTAASGEFFVYLTGRFRCVAAGSLRTGRRGRGALRSRLRTRNFAPGPPPPSPGPQRSLVCRRASCPSVLAQGWCWGEGGLALRARSLRVWDQSQRKTPFLHA